MRPSLKKHAPTARMSAPFWCGKAEKKNHNPVCRIDSARKHCAGSRGKVTEIGIIERKYEPLCRSTTNPERSDKKGKTLKAQLAKYEVH